LGAIDDISSSDLDPDLKLSRIAGQIFEAAYENGSLISTVSPIKRRVGNRSCHVEDRSAAILAIEKTIRDGIAAGLFKRVPPVMATEIFVGAISGMIDSMTLSGEYYRSDAIVPTLMEVFLGGLQLSS
jgi:hypothetical protein